ncbi:conjugal transfer protein TrbF [Phenylobacterium ferrooxidans]|uniref:Conjugal transfer protein TrbF n=1 Tax=Phenylobacterium ferrooxidans TaxID=2982689 RepID=A0ABW6CU24_9CAUL
MNPFKRPNDRYGSSAPVESPYLRASREWDNRIGSAVVQAKNWRMAAFGCMGLAALALGGFIYEASNTNIATYVVPIDKYARPGRIELAGRIYQPTTAEIGYFLADWVRRTRSKSIDPIVIRDNWTGAYHFVAGPAIGQLNSYAKANDPFANVGAQAINVEIVSVLARSPSTYQVQWRETQFNAGTSGVTENWTGLFTAKINPPKNEAELRANPLGIFITAFQWSREL